MCNYYTAFSLGLYIYMLLPVYVKSEYTIQFILSVSLSASLSEVNTFYILKFFY